MTFPTFTNALRDRALVARRFREQRAGPRSRLRTTFWIGVLAALILAGVSRASNWPTFNPIASAQESTEYGLKAEFLYRFATPYVKWPESVFPTKTSPFRVAIFGKDPFGKSLEELFRDKRVGEHPLKLLHFDSIDDLEDCQMLFVPQTEERQLAKIAEFYKKKSLLIVAESIAAAQSGAHVGFFLEKPRLRFAINPTAAKQAKLEISSELLKLAKVVENKTGGER